ncbi:hypothetical protein DMENIID0001_000710 [Sergentomyia squamirostris]
MLLYYMGMEAFEVLSDAVAPAEPEKLEYGEIVRRLTQHYGPEGAAEPTEAQYCWRFMQRRQLPAENVESFMEALKELATPCDFSCENCNIPSRIIRNQFICGLREPLIRQKLLQVPKLTMDMALELSKAMENEKAVLKTGGSSGVSNQTEEKLLKDLIQKSCFQCQHPAVKNPGNWHLVHLKELNITDWTKMIKALQEHEVSGLQITDIQQMTKNKWRTFYTYIKLLDRLQILITKGCSPNTVSKLMEHCSPGLKIMNAYSIDNGPVDLTGITRLTQLEELRLKTQSLQQPIKDLTPLASLKSLKHLSLVFLANLTKANVHVIEELSNLVSLEIGDCREFPDSFYYNLLTKLKCLKRFRIVYALTNTTAILDAVAAKATNLTELELINFALKPGFAEAIARCENLKILLLIPTYTPYHEPVNVNPILSGVSQLSSTLEVFNWTMLNEVIENADKVALKADSTVNKSGHVKGQSIAVQKPAWFTEAQTAIRPLTEINNLFNTCMPKTFCHIIRASFKETWSTNVVTSKGGKKAVRKEP